MGSQKNYLGHSVRSTSFLNVFKIILKLVEFFASCGRSGKLFGTLRKVYKHSNYILSYSELVEFFTSCGQSKNYLGHSERSTSLLTSFKIILKLVEFLSARGGARGAS